jgi:hypothetical protein
MNDVNDEQALRAQINPHGYECPTGDACRNVSCLVHGLLPATETIAAAPDSAPVIEELRDVPAGELGPDQVAKSEIDELRAQNAAFTRCLDDVRAAGAEQLETMDQAHRAAIEKLGIEHESELDGLRDEIAKLKATPAALPPEVPAPANAADEPK